MEKFIKYLEDKNYSINTIYGYRYALKDLEGYLDGRPASFINISSYLKREGTKSKPATVQFKKHVILSYLKFSKSRIYQDVEKIKIPKNETHFFYTIDDKMFLKVIKGIEDESIANLFRILYYTGIRISELKTIIYQETNNSLLVYGKGMKYREIPAFSKLQGIDWTMYRNYGKKRVYKLIRAYWPEWVTAHTFRRSFCTNLIRKGANMKIVSLVMGHAKIETTARYLHFTKTDITKELEKYS